jgi:hypothetical protein
MGTSTDAYLLYGYDLGSDDEWKIRDIGGHGGWEPAWLDEDEGLTESALKALRAAAGFTETDWRADGYFERQKAVDAQIGVEIESHCSGEYPMYVLAAKQLTARRGDVEVVDMADLQAAVASEDLDGKLARALGVLGFRPTQERPQWLLCSYWG